MIKKIILIFLIIFIISSYLLIKNSNSLIKSNLPKIENKISHIIGKKVTFGNFEIKLFPTQSILIENSKIDEVLDLNKIEIKLSLLKLLTKKLYINSIIISELEVDIRKLQNLQKEENRQPDSQDKTSDSNLDIVLDKIQIKNSKVLVPYKDRVLKISDINLISNFNLEDKIINIPNLDLNFLFGNQKFNLQLKDSNISENNKINGKLSFADSVSNFKVDNQKFDANIIFNKIESLKSIIAELEPNFVGFIPTGRIELETKYDLSNKAVDIKFSPKGLIFNIINKQINNITGDINASGTLDNLKLKTDNLILNYGTDFKIDFNLNKFNQNLEINSFNILALLGKISANGLIKDNNINIKSIIDGIHLGELSKIEDTKKLPITGIISQSKLDINGSISQPKIDGVINIKDGSFKDFNILKKISEAINNSSKISELISGKDFSIPEMDMSDTVFSNLNLIFNKDFNILKISKLKLDTNRYELISSGNLIDNKKLDLKSNLKFDLNISTKLCERSKTICGLKDDNQNINIPFILTGEIPKVIVLPEIELIVKLLLKSKAKENIGKIIDKNLKGKTKDLIKGVLGF